MPPRRRIAPAPAAALLASLAAGCAHPPPGAVRAPPRAPTMVCVGCGQISAREPADIPRWKYTVQMDDGTTLVVYADHDPALTIGLRVRISGGSISPY